MQSILLFQDLQRLGASQGQDCDLFLFVQSNKLRVLHTANIHLAHVEKMETFCYLFLKNHKTEDDCLHLLLQKAEKAFL